MKEEEKDFFERCFGIVAGLEVQNEAQAIAKEVVLDEIEDLQSQLKEKEEVIKEAREYVNHSKKNIDESGMYVETYTKWKLVSDVLDDLLEILSKGENK